MTTEPPPPPEPPTLELVQLQEERALSRFERSDSAATIQKLAEQDIILLLQLQSFDPGSSEWLTLKAALIEYGYTVFTGWGISGLLRQRAVVHRGTRNAHRIPENLYLTADEAAGLAGELMITVVESFRHKVLAAGKWDANQGASLKTFFVGWCLMHLPDCYLRWNRLERSTGWTESLDDPSFTPGPMTLRDPTAQTARDAEARIELELAISFIDDDLVVQMFRLQVEGLGLDAIGEVLGLTEPVVRTRMTRARARMRKWRTDRAS
jgi:DNA-directed RNA polymerase specialized sigma24 family protein